jgi:spore germination protein GerM
VLGALAVVAVAVAGCGLAEDDGPREIATDRVPFDLLEPSAQAPAAEPEPGNVRVQLYFVDGDRLRAVARDLPNRAATTVIAALLEGIAEDDPPGLSTAIPDGTRIEGIDIEDDIVVVSLTDQILTAVSGPQQKNAFAQFVFTVTDLRGVSGVRFRVAGQDVTAQTDQGAIAGPVDRGDYQSVTPTR